MDIFVAIMELFLQLFMFTLTIFSSLLRRHWILKAMLTNFISSILLRPLMNVQSPSSYAADLPHCMLMVCCLYVASLPRCPLSTHSARLSHCMSTACRLFIAGLPPIHCRPASMLSAYLNSHCHHHLHHCRLLLQYHLYNHCRLTPVHAELLHFSFI